MRTGEKSQKQMWRGKLRIGQAGVTTLAQETSTADPVIIDDNAAKKTA